MSDYISVLFDHATEGFTPNSWSKEYAALFRQHNEKLTAFMNRLSDSDYQELDAIHDLKNLIIGMEQEHFFKEGFYAGVQLMTETYQHKHEEDDS